VVEICARRKRAGLSDKRIGCQNYIMTISRIAIAVSLSVSAAACASSPSRAQTTPASAQTAYSKADIDFMGGMIHHHAQAIVMSRWAPTHGASKSVTTLAERIINAQQDEILSMQRWLRSHGQPVPEPDPHGMMMEMGGMKHEMLMPGMLTDEQMKQLDAARGKDFDLLFLRFMIQHHQGAVTMVNDLFATPGAAQETTVYKMASDVFADQTTEIDRMQKMLASAVFETDTR